MIQLPYDYVHLEQGSEPWKELRRKFVTATDVACFFGKHLTFKTLYGLWNQKKTGEDIFVSEAMKRGNKEESHALNFLKAQTGIVFSPVVLKSKEHPIMVSLDGMDFDGKVIAEIKVPSKGKDSPLWESAERGHIPLVYQYQIQTQLLVSQAQMCYFYVFDGEFEGVCVEVYPDLELQEKIVEKSVDFYANYLEPNIAPVDQVIEIERTDSDFVDVASELLKLQEEESVLSAQIKLLKKRLVDMCGDSPVTFGGGVKVQLVHSSKPADLKGLIRDYLPDVDINNLPEAYQPKPGSPYYKVQKRAESKKKPAQKKGLKKTA
jgi:putative phage-type endonuclease